MLTWASHIQKVVDKCKRVLNIMRYLRGVECKYTSYEKYLYKINKINV